MITQVSSRGFKGLEFDQDLDRLNMLCGPNGSGKTARSMALILAVMGTVPGIAKTNPEIFSTFAPFDADKFNVSVKIGKRPFLRRFVKTKSGSITQDYMVDRKKAKKDDFLSGMAEAGKPSIIDLGAFLGLSNAKKIEWLFSLYPPGEGLEDLEEKTQEAREKVNAARKTLSEKEALIRSLTESRSEIELPAGTLAEVDAELKQTRADYEKVQGEIREIENQERERAAAEKAKKEAVAEAEAEANKKAKMIQMAAEARAWELKNLGYTYPNGDLGLLSDERYLEIYKKAQAEQKEPARKPDPAPDVPPEVVNRGQAQTAVNRMKSRGATGHPDPYQSITAIISAMDRVGCSACAARLVALRERNKYPASAGERTGTNG